MAAETELSHGGWIDPPSGGMSAKREGPMTDHRVHDASTRSIDLALRQVGDETILEGEDPGPIVQLTDNPVGIPAQRYYFVRVKIIRTKVLTGVGSGFVFLFQVFWEFTHKCSRFNRVKDTAVGANRVKFFNGSGQPISLPIQDGIHRLRDLNLCEFVKFNSRILGQSSFLQFDDTRTAKVFFDPFEVDGPKRPDVPDDCPDLSPDNILGI